MADSRYKVRVGNAEYLVTAPDENTAWQWANMTHAQEAAVQPVQPAAPAQAPLEKSPIEDVLEEVPLVGNFLSGAADIGLGTISGATGITSAVAKAFGGPSRVSDALDYISEGAMRLMSAEERGDLQEGSRIRDEAEGKGVWEEVKAAAKQFALSPATLTGQGLGSVIPLVAAGVLSRGTALPKILGVVAGVGTVKGSIYDGIQKAAVEKGIDPETAKQMAMEAQSYLGGNLDQIALGGILGGIAARVGFEPAIARVIGKEIAERAVATTFKEAGTEAVQGGQEQFAQNLALQREGYDVPLMKGVVGQAASEAIVGGVLGGGIGAVEGFASRGKAPDAEQQSTLTVPPAVAQEFNTLFSAEVGRIMAEDPQLSEDDAVNVALERAEDIAALARANVAARETEAADAEPIIAAEAEGRVPDTGAGVDVAGGTEPSVSVAGEPGAGLGGIGAAQPSVAGGLVPSATGIQPSNVGEGERVGALTPSEVLNTQITTPEGQVAPAAAVTPSASIMPSAPTPQDVLSNIESFARSEALDRDLNPDAFTYGAQAALSGEAGVAPEALNDMFGPNGAEAFQAGNQWGTERQAEAQPTPTVADMATVEKVTPKEAPPKVETTRLVRVQAPTGELSPWLAEAYSQSDASQAAGRWFMPAEAQDQIDWYMEDAGPGAKLVYVDVPTAEVEQYRISNVAAEGNIDPRAYSRDPENEFFLPRELSDQAKEVTQERQAEAQQGTPTQGGLLNVTQSQETGVDPQVAEIVGKLFPDAPPPTQMYETPGAAQDNRLTDLYTNALYQEGINSVNQGKAIPTRQELEDAVGAFNADYFQAGVNEAVQRNQKKQLIDRMKKAPGKTARQKLFAIMEEDAKKEIEDVIDMDKSPEEIAADLGVNPYDPNYEEIVGQAGLNKDRLLKLQIAKYKGSPHQMTGVIAKELLQNSHDAVRESLRTGAIAKGKVAITTSADGRTVIIQDNGQGMSGELLASAFLQLGSTGKTQGQHSGGFGMAKSLLLYGTDKADVISARDGKIATLDTSGQQMFNAAVNDNDPSLQPRVKVRDFTQEDYAMFPEGHGTIVQLLIPEEDTNPETGKTVKIEQLPKSYNKYESLLEGLRFSPLFANTEVTYNGDIIPIGANFPLDEFKTFARVELPFGTADIYVSRQEKPYDKGVRVLSDGVWQFNKELKGLDNKQLPFEIYMNFVPYEHVKPDSAIYPFNEQRKNFSDGGEQSFNKLASLLRATFGIGSFLDEVQSFGNIQYYDPATGLPGAVIDLMPEIPQDILDRIKKAATGDESEIKIGSDGRVDVNGTTVDVENIEDLKKALPSAKDLIIEQSKIDPTRVMLHDAADVIVTDPSTGAVRQLPILDYMRESFGPRLDEFLFYVGSKFGELRNQVVEVMERKEPGGYKDLLNEAVGNSLDPRYRGVSTKVPFSGMFLNPLVPEATDPYERLEGIVKTMIHELAHYKVRDHDAGFPAEMQRIEAALRAEKRRQGFDYNKWVDGFTDHIINNGYSDIIDAGQYLFATKEDRENGTYSWRDPQYTNARVVYRGGRFSGGSPEQVPERGAQGQGPAENNGSTSGRGAGTERLLGPAYEGREGAGGRGDDTASDAGGTEPINNETVDKTVKLTKAQLQRAAQAAGIERMKMTAMQKRILRSRTGTEDLSLAGKLVAIVRNRDSDVNLLTSLFNSTPPTVLQKLLGPMMTEDVVRLAERAGMKNPTEIDRMMREEYLPYVNRLMQKASEISERWADFIARNEEGARILMEVMLIANMYNVDPLLAPTAGEYMKIDAPLQALIEAEKNATTDKAKKAIQNQMAIRRGEIKRVYFGGVDENGNVVQGWNDLSTEENGNGAGKIIFRMARDEYRKSFNEHYRLLMERISTSGKDPAEIARIRTSIDNMFAKAAERVIYFPLKRFGEYWVSVGKGKSGEFHMFESASAQDAFVARLRSEGEGRTITAGFGRDSLRNAVANKDASAALKEILDMLDGGGLSDVNLLKDHIFQMYLSALPEADMRRRFLHREFKAGFSTDGLRTFAATSVSAANQLGRLAYNYKFKNLIDASYKETEDLEYNPAKRRLDTITRELELRVDGMLSPEQTSGVDWLLSIGAKGTFLFLLSSPKSAIMNLTQLHIVGLPTLAVEFGEKAVAAMAARYTAGLVSTNRLAAPYRDADGNVKLEIPEVTLEGSKYVEEMKQSDPAKYEAIQKAWNFAREHDVTQSTFAASSGVYERSNTPTEKFGFAQAVRKGDLVTAAQRATANAIDALGALFHNTERMGREIMYMSAFELAYDRAVKEGKTPEEATDIAMPLAAQLTNKGMFDFSNWNKSRYSKSRLGRLPLQMRSYSLAMTSLMFRSFVNMMPYFNKEGKMAAAKIFFGVGALTALYGGLRASQFYVLGMMGYGLLQWAASAGDDDEERKKAEIEGGYLDPETIQKELLKYADSQGRELSKKDMDYYIRSVWIPETFGNGGTLANALGLSPEVAKKLETAADIGLPGVFGVDISNSVSLGDLWHPVDVKSDDPEVAFYERLGRMMFGPSSALISAPYKAVREANAGNFDKAIEATMPAAIRNYLKSQRLEEEGLVVGKDGDVIIKDPSFYDTYMVTMQALGFAEAQTSRAMQMDIEAIKIEKTVAAERTDLLNKRYRALVEFSSDPNMETQKALQAAERDIKIYNLNYPSNAITEKAKVQSAQNKAAEARSRAGALGYNPKIPVRQAQAERRRAEDLGQ